MFFPTKSLPSLDFKLVFDVLLCLRQVCTKKRLWVANGSKTIVSNFRAGSGTIPLCVMAPSVIVPELGLVCAIVQRVSRSTKNLLVNGYFG